MEEEEEDFAESVSDKIVQKPPQTQLQKPALSGCDDSKNILATLPQARGSSQQLDCIMAPLVHTSAPRAPLADDSDDASGPRHCGAAASVRSLAPILLEPANTPLLTSLSQSRLPGLHCERSQVVSSGLLSNTTVNPADATGSAVRRHCCPEATVASASCGALDAAMLPHASAPARAARAAPRLLLSEQLGRL